MNICKTEQEYITAIAPAVQKVCKLYGYLPSVLIAQSCLENGYGIPSYWDNPQIEALIKYNNMVGIKAELLSASWADKTVWPGKSLTKKTPETYGGKNVIITDDFRIYDNIEQSFADFLLFLKYGAYTKGGKPKYGDEVLRIKDPEQLIKAVHSRGYATGSTYSSNVMKIIKKHNLAKYDDLTGVTATKYTSGYKKTATKKESAAKTIKLQDKVINDITIRNRDQIPRSRGGNKVKFIVVHYLGVPNADNPDLYGGGYGGHYNITRRGIIYKAADPKTAVVWHCGGGLQGSGGHKYHGICTNYNSIGIECGVSYTEQVKSADGDSGKWYFEEATQESLVWLVAKLMDEYGVSISHVIRHYDVTGKICPNPYVKNNNLRTSWTWDQFKANLQQYRKNRTITIPDREDGEAAPKPAPSRSYLQRGDSGSEVKAMQKMLIACGYSCGGTGADGAFGAKTLAALKAFQKAAKLTVDGLYGPRSKTALTAAYKAVQEAQKKKKTGKKTAADISPEQLLKACKKVMDTARKNGYKYGSSNTLPPCNDKVISCDRLIARALYDLGFTDQPKGGITVGNMDSYLTKWGFHRSTNKDDIRPGSIVLVRHQNHLNRPGQHACHAFVINTFNDITWENTRYDAGSTSRIKTPQPITAGWGYPKGWLVVFNASKPGPRPWQARCTGTASKDGVLLKTQPNKAAESLYRLDKGNRFELSGETSGKWSRAKVIDRIGWIYTPYIIKD